MCVWFRLGTDLTNAPTGRPAPLGSPTVLRTLEVKRKRLLASSKFVEVALNTRVSALCACTRVHLHDFMLRLFACRQAARPTVVLDRLICVLWVAPQRRRRAARVRQTHPSKFGAWVLWVAPRVDLLVV